MSAVVDNPTIGAIAVQYIGAVATPTIPAGRSPTPTRTPTLGPGTLPGELDPFSIPKFVNPLPHPLSPAFKWTPSGVNAYNLGIFQAFQNVLGPGFQNTRIFGYGNVADPSQTATWPGRTFEVTRGVGISVTWSNNLVNVSTGRPLTHFLSIDTSVPWADPLSVGSNGAQSSVPVVVHVHGVAADQYSDGHPMAWFTPGYAQTGDMFSSPVAYYPNAQDAGHPWYHDHAMGITRLNVYAGLAGNYFVRDSDDTGKSDNPLGLPAYPYEVPIAIQDRRFDLSHQLFLPSASFVVGGPNPSIQPFFFGRVMVVNGKAWPAHQVEPRKYRLRILNGCNDRILGVSFPGGSIAQIGTDAGFLNQVVTFGVGQSLLIASGERADIVVDFAQWGLGSTVTVMNTAGLGDGSLPFPGLDDRIMLFNISIPLTVPALGDGPLRTSYRSAPYALNVSAVSRTRQLGLYEQVDAYGRMLMRLGTRYAAYGFSDPVSEVLNEGATEIWELQNYGGMMHPMHLHLVSFQVLGRYSLSNPSVVTLPSANENGPKDIVWATPGMATRVLATFPLGMIGSFVWHCHILSHEDYDMMRPYTVVPQNVTLPTDAPTPTSGPTIPPNAVTIAQIGYGFVPATLTIFRGTPVLFTFTEPLGHNVARVSDAESQSPISTTSNYNEATFFRDFIDPATLLVTFATAGDVYFICQPHASSGMRGVIHVLDYTSTAVATAPTTNGPNPTPTGTATPNPTPTFTRTPSPSFTPSPSSSPTPSRLPTLTPSWTFTPSPTPIPTPTASPSSSSTPLPNPTASSSSLLPTPSRSPLSNPAQTPTFADSVTLTPSPNPAITPLPTDTPIPSPTTTPPSPSTTPSPTTTPPSFTPTLSLNPTPTPTPSNTPTPSVIIRTPTPRPAFVCRYSVTIGSTWQAGGGTAVGTNLNVWTLAGSQTVNVPYTVSMGNKYIGQAGFWNLVNAIVSNGVLSGSATASWQTLIPGGGQIGVGFNAIRSVSTPTQPEWVAVNNVNCTL